MIKDREFIERTNEKIKRGSDRKREVDLPISLKVHV